MNNYKDSYLEFYNSAYISLLNKVPYDILINNFLDKINNLFNIDRSSLIAQYNNKNNSLYNLNISRKNIIKSKQEIDISLSPDFNLNSSNCLISESIKKKKVIIEKNVSYNKIFGDTFSSNINFYVNIIIIPLIFNNSVNGVMCMLTSYTLEEFVDDAYVLSNLLGNLIYNYNNLKYSIDDTYSKNKFLVYQIIGDILNLVNDGIIILDNLFSIKYFNEISFNIIKEIYPDSTENTLMDEYIADIFTPFYTLINEKKKNYFKNKTIDFNKGYLKLKFFLNTIIIRNDLYHIITIYKNENISIKKSFCNNIIGYLSHELRNPIQSISNGCFILNYELLNNKNYDNINKITENLSRNCKDMAVIIDDVLDLSKINSGEFIINLEICNINDIINIIISDFNDLAKEKNLKLSSKIYENVPDTLYTDPTRIYQILSNLVSNSIKYSNYGNINIEIIYNNNNHGIDFEIKDEGKGIKDIEVCNLFKEFGITTNSYNNKSNGLGLCVSQKIANLLGGKIIVDTEYNKGSTFTFFHPIKLGSSGKFNQKIKLNKNLKANILIIDSHINNAMIFKLFLNTINIKHNTFFNVDIVESQDKAFNLLDNNNYQFIFIDVNQNLINGITLSNIFRNKYSRNLKLIATTGNINLISKDILSNFNDVLIKPFDDMSLLNILNKNLDINEC